MRALLTAAVLAAAVLALGTTLIATQTPRVHDALMQQLATSGLVSEQASRFEPGWLRATNSGRLQLTSSLCAGCDELAYAGEVYQGLGAWLRGELAILSLDYRLQLPALPIEPALPPLSLSALQTLAGLSARIALPASAHTYDSAAHAWRLRHGGVAGRLQTGQLALRTPELALARDDRPWLALRELDAEARADETVRLDLAAAGLQVPPWSWQAERARARYVQQAHGPRLDLALELDIAGGRVAGADVHPPLGGRLQIDRLDLPATRAFVARLPGLMSPRTPPAARMFGLLSLYSVHGPAFFGAAPRLQLHADALPLTGGPGAIAIDVAIAPGTTRPPMHPREWQRALSGELDVTAPRRHLARWWASGADLLATVTGLPRSYAALLEQGWVVPLPDGRDRLYLRLDPQGGPQRAS